MPPTGRRRRQGGQILPIAAIGIIVLAGIAGLAIDGSRDYLAKRNAQNAADFATLAAAKQLTLQPSLSGPVSANSNPVKAAHDFAANNGFPTNYNNACDSSAPSSFSTTWFDVPGVPCGAKSGFGNKVSINSPPVDLPSSPVPQACQGAAQYSCFQVVITTRVSEVFAAVLGITTAYVTVGATAHATLPGNSANLPPPNALVLYEPQSACDGGNQCFNESNPVGRANLACTGTSNCPTYWTTSTASTKIYGYDGQFVTPQADLTAVQSNGDMVIQQRTTFCDPYNGATCAANTVVGAAGFALPVAAKAYCSQYGTGALTITPCTTTGQATEAELDSSQGVFQTPSYWHASVNTSGLRSCGALILNGNAISGPCANAQEPYLIEPGIYTYIAINHGTYEFDQGLFDITGTAPVNTNSAAGYIANGIDHSRETATDFDLCSGATPTSCPGLTAGVWLGHGGGSYSAYVPPANGACSGGFGSGSSGGGGDSTVISGSGTVFRLESTSGGFVSTHEVSGLSLAGAGVGALSSVGGTPLLIDEENSSFIHLDAIGSHSNSVQGIIYQTPSATSGGVEINLGLNNWAAGSGMTGQVLAYSFTSFGTGGTLNFSNGYGAGGVAGIQTSGRNETSIISSVSLTPAVGRANFETLTVNYTDEWALDGYDVFLKVNNGSPIFFSQGIWTTVPSPGAPLPPPNNNPSDTYPAYPNSAQPGSYSINPLDSTDWTVTIPNSGGATFELAGDWTWGHQSDIPNANSGSYTAQAKYTLPNPNGSYVAITVFVTDGDHCGDYALASYTFRNTGQPGGGNQSVGSVVLVQ